jgi:hypothetical protein
MSQYSFRAGRHEIVVGWDNPLETFFVQVWDESADEDDPVLWAGARPGEVASVEALAELVRPYGEVPDELLGRLREDSAAREPLTEWQRRMRASVVKS